MTRETLRSEAKRALEALIACRSNPAKAPWELVERYLPCLSAMSGLDLLLSDERTAKRVVLALPNDVLEAMAACARDLATLRDAVVEAEMVRRYEAVQKRWSALDLPWECGA